MATVITVARAFRVDESYADIYLTLSVTDAEFLQLTEIVSYKIDSPPFFAETNKKVLIFVSQICAIIE